MAQAKTHSSLLQIAFITAAAALCALNVACSRQPSNTLDFSAPDEGKKTQPKTAEKKKASQASNAANQNGDLERINRDSKENLEKRAQMQKAQEKRRKELEKNLKSGKAEVMVEAVDPETGKTLLDPVTHEKLYDCRLVYIEGSDETGRKTQISRAGVIRKPLTILQIQKREGSIEIVAVGSTPDEARAVYRDMLANEAKQRQIEEEKQRLIAIDEERLKKERKIALHRAALEREAKEKAIKDKALREQPETQGQKETVKEPAKAEEKSEISQVKPVAVTLNSQLMVFKQGEAPSIFPLPFGPMEEKYLSINEKMLIIPPALSKERIHKVIESKVAPLRYPAFAEDKTEAHLSRQQAERPRSVRGASFVYMLDAQTGKPRLVMLDKPLLAQANAL